MITAALALFGAFGAWLAWRRNPMYSASSSVRILGVVAVSIAVLVLAVVGAVKFTENRSAPVVFGTMLTVVVLGTFAMIFVIQTVSTPKRARLATELPPSAKIVQVHRRKVYHWAKYLGALIAIFAVLGAVVPGNAKYIALSFGGMALLLAIILLPVAYVNARHFDRSLTALELDPWIHWKYAPAQWNEWVNAQVERMKTKPATFILKRDWHKLAWPFVIIAGGVIIFSPGSMILRILYVLFCCGAIAGIVVLGAREEKRAPDKMRAVLEQAAPEVYFGHDGIFCDGVFTTWLSLNVYLVSASIDERPPRSLTFSFEKVQPGPYTANQISAMRQSVLLPAAAEADLARLQRELSARCPKARVELAAIAQ
jgi:hypothetical protein